MGAAPRDLRVENDGAPRCVLSCVPGGFAHVRHAFSDRVRTRHHPDGVLSCLLPREKANSMKKHFNKNVFADRARHSLVRHSLETIACIASRGPDSRRARAVERALQKFKR